MPLYASQYTAGKTVPQLNEASSAAVEDLLLIFNTEAGLQRITAENIRSTMTALTDEKLTAEISRATNAEANNAKSISTETTRALVAEKTNADAISTETTRAKKAEAANTNNISSLTTRMMTVEAGTSANASDISTEISRAQTAEQTNTNSITALESVVSGHTTSIATNVKNINTNASNISAEIKRAQAAESTLTTNLNSEITRATAAERDISDSLTLKTSDLWYNSFTSGVRFFHYIGKDVTEYSIPTRNCFLIVMRGSSSGGTNTGAALAIQRSGNDASVPTGLWVNRLTGEMTDPAQWAGWTKIADNSTGTSSASGLTKLYTATGTATDGTMTQAAISSALAALTSDAMSMTYLAYWHNSFSSGFKTFYYEGQDTTTYKIPTKYCVVIVAKYSNARGIALAVQWQGSTTTSITNMWICHLHDDTNSNSWSNWSQLAGPALTDRVAAIESQLDGVASALAAI